MNARPDLFDIPVGMETGQQIAKFKASLRQLESDLWSGDFNEQTISYYQQSFRNYETLLEGNEDIDHRAHFIITIPVADRPEQLHNCMQSILNLCELYNYGGFNDGLYTKISILVADDSSRQESITRNRSLCRQFSKAGLKSEYFGAKEQLAIIRSLPDDMRIDLESALGTINEETTHSNFSHKGASIMRNITYLRLRKLSEKFENALIYFIDSDQEFCVNIETDDAEQHAYAINYFHHINEIFSTTDTEILTGKVVGDPPVSSSVMAGNFLDDVIAFIELVSDADSRSDCQFHATHKNLDDASYHDMAGMFGFKTSDQTHAYHCTLTGKHTNHDCLLEFSSKLNNFFHGEHPTRSTQFAYTGNLSTTVPARTVYTGNYIFKPEHLNHHIAFADLHLRMAGPTLGRLLKAEIGDKFTSANLPMLHRRTITETGRSEYRPDIEQTPEHVDLSGEFVRQYFGDIMLFTIDELTHSGYPKQKAISDKVSSALKTIEQNIHQQYIDKHFYIDSRAKHLNSLISQTDKLFGSDAIGVSIKNNLKVFLDNIEHNFGERSSAYELINNDDAKKQWLAKLHKAILSHSSVTKRWKQLVQ